MSFNITLPKQPPNSALLDYLSKIFSIKYSLFLESLFLLHVNSYDFLVDLNVISKNIGTPIIMVACPKSFSEYWAKQDLEKAFSAINKSSKEQIPFINFNFIRNKNQTYGEEYNDVHLFFATKDQNVEDTEKTIHSCLNKLLKLKAFV